LIVLDTHVLIWLVEGSDRLGTRCRTRLDKAFRDEELAVSAITFWEIATLKGKRRLDLHGSVAEWRAERIATGLIEAPVAGGIGVIAAELDAFHGDPADRILVATAREANARLCTADRRILSWESRRRTLDARS